MNKNDLLALRQLKKSVEEVFKKRFATCTDAIEDWKGKQIKLFQQDLMEQVGGHVSEKWFYTHIKTTENKKLPRIDILDLLSTYVGYENWTSFRMLNVECLILNEEDNVKQEVAIVEDLESDEGQNIEGLALSVANLAVEPNFDSDKEKKETKSKGWIWLWTSVASVGALVFILVGTMKLLANAPVKYRFCFVDADDRQAISNNLLKIQWLKKDESPLVLSCDSAGCIEVEASEEIVSLVVGGLYYKTDTIVRQLNPEIGTETIELKKDDYALMLHYFSKTKIKDWKKRREQLSLMIAPDARIVQVYDANNLGMELYNKEEFIDKLTMPIGSLGKIEILETHYSPNGLMQDIRFRQVD